MSKVMVVAPMRSRIAPKFGSERAITRSPSMQPDRKSALLILKPEMLKL